MSSPLAAGDRIREVTGGTLGEVLVVTEVALSPYAVLPRKVRYAGCRTVWNWEGQRWLVVARGGRP